MLQRADWFAFRKDAFGKWHDPDGVSRYGIKDITRTDNEVVMEGGMDNRDLCGVLCPDDHERDRILEKLGKAGITHIGDVPVEDFVKMSDTKANSKIIKEFPALKYGKGT